MNTQSQPHPLRVLAVDDNPQALQTVVAFLAVDGHTVETATSGQEGLQKFQAQRFDLVVTNQRMPDMRGDQLAAAIKQLDERCPIIMLTAVPPDPKPPDVDIVLSKPTTLAAFRQAVAQVTHRTP